MLATPLPDESALFGGYRLAAYDEMFEGPSKPRPHYAALHERLVRLGPDELERGIAKVQSLKTKGEEEVKLEAVVEHVKGRLAP